MKAFAIRDTSIQKDRDLAWLLYDPDSMCFTIEISEDVDEWEAPLILSSFVKKGKRSVDPYWSQVWVEQRIVPRERQNLGTILRDNGLEEYDPCRLLILSDGRCAQDDCFIVPLPEKKIPGELRRRLSLRLSGFLHSGDHSLLFFRDGMVRSITQEELPLQEAQRMRLLQYHHALSNARDPEIPAGSSNPADSVGTVDSRPNDLLQLFFLHAQGSGLALEDDYHISYEDLRNAGTLLPVNASDFHAFVQQNVVDTASAAELLHCTRQNIQDLVRRKKLTPVKVLKNNFLFLREDLGRPLT